MWRSIANVLKYLQSCSLGVLIKVVREGQMDFIIQKLVALSGSHEGELRDIAGLRAPHSSLSCGHAA